ncbi:MAG: 4Fe-4S binding protein [Nitrospirota bacterium]|nr:4Fe-4S binding protein [Nitrospirota bacterium]
MNARRLIRIRHLVQWSLLALFVLIPFTGLFRVDVAAGRFLVAGWQIWWDDFFIVFGFWSMVFFSMTAFYSNLGMIFCGWMCPQHTLSEWLNNLIRTLLGRRVLAGISPERQEGRSKRKGLPAKVAAWSVFLVVVLALSTVLTLACLHYFFTAPELLAHFLGGEFNLYIAVFTVMLGSFVVVDLGLLRHFWCKYMCPYGLWQYMFRGPGTLQIHFATEREGDCKSCSLCKDVCPVDLDPRQPEVYTRCINCAVCIDACEGYMGRFGKAPILSFGFGTRAQQGLRIQNRRNPLLAPGVLWPLAGVAAGAALFAGGLKAFQPVKLTFSAVQRTAQVGADGVDYNVSIVNKDDRPHRFVIHVIPPDGARAIVTTPSVALGVGERGDLPVRITHGSLAYDRPYTVQLEVEQETSGRRFADSVTYYVAAPVSAGQAGDL